MIFTWFIRMLKRYLFRKKIEEWNETKNEWIDFPRTVTFQFTYDSTQGFSREASKLKN